MKLKMPDRIEGLESGTGIPVISPGRDRKFVLDEEELTKLLMKEDIKDRSVVLISVAGAFRMGKSFLLNFFLRYMHHKYVLKESSDDWLGSAQELKGFSWRAGSERHTTGLLLWSQPFIATLPNGDEVVILVMDTQGTFDNESTMYDNVTVFALSTLLSSVQIYNLTKNIREDDLQYLQLYANYGKLAAESSNEKAFQHLKFLVRDWEYKNYKLGEEGGRDFLEERLKVKDNQIKELQNLRRDIRSCFEEISCFLMPHPGGIVAGDPEFKGRVDAVGDDFIKCLKELVSILLSPQNLVPKRINGKTVLAKDLINYFKSYTSIFSGGTLPKADSILEAMAKGSYVTAQKNAKEAYEKEMDERTKFYLEPKILEEENKRAKKTALHIFQSMKKLGDEEMAKSYEDELVQALDEKYKKIVEENEGKNWKKKALSTAIVFVVFGVLGFYVLDIFGSIVGIEVFNQIGSLILFLSIMILFAWGYSKVFSDGHAAAIIDSWAGMVTHRWLKKTIATLATASVEDKKKLETENITDTAEEADKYPTEIVCRHLESIVPKAFSETICVTRAGEFVEKFEALTEGEEAVNYDDDDEDKKNLETENITNTTEEADEYPTEIVCRQQIYIAPKTFTESILVRVTSTGEIVEKVEVLTEGEEAVNYDDDEEEKKNLETEEAVEYSTETDVQQIEPTLKKRKVTKIVNYEDNGEEDKKKL